MKNTTIKPLLTATTCLALFGACADGNQGVYSGSAGDFLNEGYFGSPPPITPGCRTGTSAMWLIWPTVLQKKCRTR